MQIISVRTAFPGPSRTGFACLYLFTTYPNNCENILKGKSEAPKQFFGMPLAPHIITDQCRLHVPNVLNNLNQENRFITISRMLYT